MKNLLKPLAQAARSFLGIDGLSPKLAEINAVLASLNAKMVPLEAIARRADQQSAATASVAMLGYVALTGDPPVPSVPPTTIKGGSRMCRQRDFATDAFRYWTAAIHQPISMQRKIWEWYFVADALFQRECLRPGRSGIAFGVGREPLPSLFASMGCDIVATDMSLESAASAGWAKAQQHAAELESLNERGICDPTIFSDRVRFRVMDMNNIPNDLDGEFDFCWSSCALEHLGSLEHGLRFVKQSMRLLKPGGIGVHTTEFNMSSNTSTFEAPALSLYRRRDLEALTTCLESAGHRVEPFDWDEGSGYADDYVDLPPYFTSPVEQHMHLRLRIADFDCTSIGMIVHKGERGTT